MRGYYLVHAIAECRDCDFRDEDYKTAQKSGAKHHYETGHAVGIDTGYMKDYERSTVKHTDTAH